MIVVAGAGVAGLSAALALGRAGHDVTLVERDPLTASEPLAAFDWKRQGVPHFLQPHAFLPRGRLVMKQHFPDVYAALLDAGALEIDPAQTLMGECRPGDEEMIFLAVRRPLIEWALRNAVWREPRIRLRPDTRIVGLLGTEGPLPRIEGIRTGDGQPIAGSLVVDALGRNSPVPAWIEELGGKVRVEAIPCGFLYYSRYFQLLPGVDFPEGPWILGPRTNLGRINFMTFLGDNRTFAIAIGVPVSEHDFRVLQHAPAFMAACRDAAPIRRIVDAAVARPIAGVQPLGALHNTLRHYCDGGRLCAPGILPVADAICHTDPSHALGLSFALVHAGELLSALAKFPGDTEAQSRSYFRQIEAEIGERFATARDITLARQRMANGEKLDASRRTGCFPLFALLALSAVALCDPEIFRKAVRRTGFLDRTSVFDHDVGLQERVESLFAELQAEQPPAPAAPDMGALLARWQAAAAESQDPQ